MTRLATPSWALVVAAALAPAALGSTSAALPTSPGAVAALLVALFGLWVVVVVPSVRGARVASVLEVAIVAAPAFVAVALPDPALAIPWTFLAIAFAAGLVATWLRGVARSAVVAAAVCALAGGAALAAAGVGDVSADGTHATFRLPVVARPPTSALVVHDVGEGLETVDVESLVPTSWRSPSVDAPRRAGALARAPGAHEWPGGAPPWAAARWIPVPSSAADLPAAGPVVRVVGTADVGGVLGAAKVVTGPLRADDARDLDAFDAVVVGTDDVSVRDGEVLAAFVRRGGLLVGPAAARPWPAAVARALTVHLPDGEGPADAKRIGAGHVARAGDAGDVEALLAAGLHRPRIATVFDRALVAPATPASLTRAGSDPPQRPASVGFALLATLALGLASALVVRRRLVVITGLAVLASALGATRERRARGPIVEAFAIETAPGGRRVEAWFVQANEGGWLGTQVGLAAPADGLRVLGFRVVRTPGGLALALPPGGEGWIVVEGVARGDTTGLTSTAMPPDWALGLLDRPAGEALEARAFGGMGPAGVAPGPGIEEAPRGRRTLILRPR